MAKLSKKNKKIQYIWQQIEYWLQYRFKTPLQIEVDTQTGLTREYHIYSITTFKNNQFVVKVDNKHLMEATKDDLLNIVGREAIRIYLFTKGINAKETDAEYKKLLHDFGLPNYGVLPHEGVDFYEYRCSQCNRLMGLSVKRVPKSKGITYNPKTLSDCCGAVIKESDVKQHYSNQEAQKYYKLINKYN